MEVCARPIADLVTHSALDLKPLSLMQYEFAIVENHLALPLQNKEELLRSIVRVHDLALACGYALLDHAAIAPLDEVPSIAAIAPTIVFGVFSRDRAHQCGCASR
jgi:hypothetical protein